MQGDVIKSQTNRSTYINGTWRGAVKYLNPGVGYHYYSNNPDIVTLVLDYQIVPEETITVTTGEPTDITAESATISGEVALLTDSHVFMRGVCWGTTSNSDIDGSYFLDGAGEGSFIVTFDELTPNTTYYVRAYAVSDHGLAYGEEKSFTTLDNGGGDHAYVDLGLPSGLLWATCNVGADTPEDYGDYFAWGETTTKSTYNWSTYQYCNGSYNTLAKYCNKSNYGYNGFTDKLTTLLPEDDAATANWGTDWRMPTKEEWQELFNNTTVTWTTQNGVNGRLFTASNGNSLFLPAAGCRDDSSLYNAGSYGVYWSSSLNTGSPSSAWSFDFNSDDCGMSNYYRYCGQSVRPVRSLQPITAQYTVIATPNDVEGGIVTNIQQDLTCTLTATANDGYTFTNWTENDSVALTNATYTFTVTGDRTLVANFTQNGGTVPTGAINGLFSVSADQQVYFSKGNLQYQASTNTWKFAENQYDYVGSTNSNISSSYSGWIDLFGWGTSGWNSGNTYYHPWDSNYSSESTYGPPGQYNLTGSYANADWGVYNPISNGGNQANQWRTLTQAEWTYVFNTRSTTSGIRYAKAKVNNVNGVILVPDNWSASTYSLRYTNSNGANFSSNTISASQWTTLESAGAVFLPAAGYRYGTSVYAVGSDGYYWSASYYNSYGAYVVYFVGSSLGADYYYRCYGLSVRLVCPAE